MKQVRIGVFETNSSSTHSITMCSKEEWQDFKDGKLFKTYDDKFITDKDNYVKPKRYFNDPESYDDWSSGVYNEGLDVYSECLTTPKGEEIVVFGKYGRDG